MDNWIETIIAMIIIFASIFADRKKSAGVGPAKEEVDLSELSEFFKKNAEGDNSLAKGSDRQTESFTESFSDFSQKSTMDNTSSSFEQETPKQLPVRKGKKRRPPKPPPIPSKHPSSEGACLDEQESLTGKVDYESPGFSVQIPRSGSFARAVLPRTKLWTKKRIMDGFVLSTLLERYDINRFYSRIPDQRN